MSVVRLSDAPITKTPYGRWQRLNEPLGVRAFGVNAVVVDPGEELDIDHDESDGGQQEVYVVVSGRAAFRIGEEELEAGPGTVVAAPDPAVRRGYRALEPGTRIVCVGGVPSDRAPAFGDWILEAAEG